MGNNLKKINKPEDVLDTIIENTINNIVKRLINKDLSFYYDTTTGRKMMERHKIYDLNKIKEYLDTSKKHVIPKDIDNDKYYEMNKKEFSLFLFKYSEEVMPSYSINYILYMLFKKNINIFLPPIYKVADNNKDINNTNLYEDSIKSYFRFMFQIDDINDIIYILIVIPSDINIKLRNEFEIYFKNILKKNNPNYTDNFIDNEYKKFIYELDTYSTSTSKYLNKPEDVCYSYYIKKSTGKTLSNSLWFNVFFTFLIINSPNDYLFSTLDIVQRTINNITGKEDVNAHRNQVFIQKVYDEKELDIILLYHYEPHGSNISAFSNINNISDIYNMFRNNIINDYYKGDPKYQIFLYDFDYNTNFASCTYGPQSISASQDIGFCTIFSNFWYICLLSVLCNINLYDKYLGKMKKENTGIVGYINNLFGINNNIDRYYISNISINNWIQKIDKKITDLKDTFKVNYDINEYNVDNLLNTIQYIFEQDYRDNENYFLTNTGYSNIQHYVNIVKKSILIYCNSVNPKINKINIDKLLDIYYDKILPNIQINKIKYGIDLDIIKLIKMKKYNLRDVGYYNIFVEYGFFIFNKFITYNELLKDQTIDYNIHNFILSDDLKNFCDQLVDSNISRVSIRKDLRNLNDPKDLISYNQRVYNIQKYEKMTKEYDIAKQTGGDLSLTELEKFHSNENTMEYILGDSDMDKGKKIFEELNIKREEEKSQYENKNCIKDTDCKDNRLECGKDEDNKNLCIPNRNLILEECNKDKDCFSNYCKEYEYEISDPNSKKRKKVSKSYCA